MASVTDIENQEKELLIPSGIREYHINIVKAIFIKSFDYCFLFFLYSLMTIIILALFITAGVSLYMIAVLLLKCTVIPVLNYCKGF